MTTTDRDPGAEQEVDLGRYAAVVAARWWLPALGLVLGIALGWLLAVGGEQVYVGRAVVYLGQPLSPSGSAPVQSLNTNPRFVRETITSTANVRRVARAVGTTPAKLRAGVSSQPVTGAGPARAGQNPLVAISVRTEQAAKARDAAQALAELTVHEVSTYARAKIRTLERRIESRRSEIASLDRRIAAAEELAAGSGGSSTDKLVAVSLAGLFEQRRASVEEDLALDEQLLSLAEDVELARVVDDAAAQKTTARSKRNSIVVSGALGLLLGLVAALLWDWTATRVGRSAAR